MLKKHYAFLESPPIWVTANNAAHLLSCGRTFLYDQIKKGKLVTMKLGNKRLISYASIVELER